MESGLDFCVPKNTVPKGLISAQIFLEFKIQPLVNFIFINLSILRKEINN